jgi:alpha-galactosidase
VKDHYIARAIIAALLVAAFTAQAEDEDTVILTPPAPDAPRIHCPNVYGVRPGSPFLYRIPATGVAPITYGAKHLPAGLVLDPASGIVTGQIAKAGTWRVTWTATNAHGKDRHTFRIVAGDKLALTPPMGWNSWYIHYDRVCDPLMRLAADQMISTGMAAYGYQYVNIDDCWMKKRGDEPYRNAEGAVLPSAKFPDMAGMVDYIHGKGLKAGLYTSPGPWTCGGYVGAYGHEAADAKEFADWGFDFLKYDWCSYGKTTDTNDADRFQKPYRLMWGELQKQNRDIVFNLCQYGMHSVWQWGGEVGNCWRTGGDLGLVGGAGLPGFYKVAFSNAQRWPFAKPGGWNDPDYILIGWVGDARGWGAGKETPLTPNEQYSYMSLWSLMAAPLIFSGDMAKLDAFTLNVLCNSEVIAVNQDELGRQARIIRKTPDQFILLKDMADGSKELGLFNLEAKAQKISVSWEDLGLTGRQKIRDSWRQKELGVYRGSFEAETPGHGVVLVRLTRKYL